jgi:hypothetical protein
MKPVQRLLFSAAAHDGQTAALLHRYAERSAGPAQLLSPHALARAAAVSAVSVRCARQWRPDPLCAQRPAAHRVPR